MFHAQWFIASGTEMFSFLFSSYPSPENTLILTQRINQTAQNK